MIKLKIGDNIADLKPDTRIDFVLNNPIFNGDNLSPGSYTLPFRLAGGGSSPKNAAIFKNPDVIENAEIFVQQLGELFFDGIPYKSGKIKPTTISGDNIEAAFIFGLSTVSDEFKTKKLRDIINEEIIIDDTPITKKIYVKAPGLTLDPFELTVNGRLYQGETVAELVTAINTDTTEPRAVAVLQTEGETPEGMEAPFIELTPYTEPDNILSPLSLGDATLWGVEPFDPTSYFAGLDSFMDGYITASYPNDAIRFPLRFNDDPYGEGFLFQRQIIDGRVVESGTKITNLVNAINHTGLIKNRIYGTVPGFGGGLRVAIKNMNSLQPFIRLKWVLDCIAEYFDFQFTGDWYDDEDTNNALIDNTILLDYPMDFLGVTRYVFFRRSFNLRELVPDLSVVDFLKALQSRYNLAIYRDELTGKIGIWKREEIAKSVTYNDITNKCSPVKGIDDTSIPGLKLSAKLDEKDLYSVVDEFSLGDASEVKPTIISALGANHTASEISGTTGDNIWGPIVKQPVSDKFEFRIFYYSGLRDAEASSNNFSYPSASIDAANFIERFNGTDGIYDKFWRRWLQYEMNRRVVNIDVTFHFQNILDLEWQIKQRFDRNNYLIKSLKFALTPTGLTKCQAELYTMV